jgi:hypothetical protein
VSKVALVLRKARRVRRGLSNAYRRWWNRRRIVCGTWLRHGRHFSAGLDPLRILWIDPRRLKHLMNIKPEDFLREVWGVVGGEWDIGLPELETDCQYVSFISHLRDGTPWEETAFVQEVLARVESGEAFWHGCRSREDVLERCAKVDRLHARIRDQGYLTQQELLEQGLSSGGGTQPPELNEIVVNVGRNGEFIFVDGIHRLAIARALEIDRVPVCVLVRHRQWQAYRDSLVEPGVELSPGSEHPDLSYLFDTPGN